MLAIAAAALNGLTTGDHPVRALIGGRANVAVMDVMLLVGAGIALWSARRLGQSQRAVAAVAGAHGQAPRLGEAAHG